MHLLLVPVAMLSKEWVCSHLLVETVGSNLAGASMSVHCGSCVYSGRGLCDELITCPEESYLLWCVWV